MGKQEVWSAEQFQKHYQKTEGAKMRADYSKYHNVITEVDGIKFQSKKEAEYYGKLKIRKRAGEILDFERQKVYKIFVKGELICKYIADFVVTFPDGIVVVIDVKSVATRKNPVFRIKQKLMQAVLGIKIEIA